MTKTTSLVEAIVGNLNPAERIELQQVLSYLDEKSHAPHMAENNIADILNRCSPNVRAQFGIVKEMMGTPRTKPYQEKMTVDDYADQLQLDRGVTRNVYQAMEDAEVAAGIQQRLGTDADTPDTEPDTRDIIGAAMDFHTQHGEQ